MSTRSSVSRRAAGCDVPMSPTSQLLCAWSGVFRFGQPDAPELVIRLAQMTASEFRLDTRVEYLGRTGLERVLSVDSLADIRVIEHGELDRTDLASVPRPLRWFVNAYGVHTPAALIHDRLVPVGAGSPPGLTDVHADSYFRHMLEAVGVPWIRRWLMWTAVASRTRLTTQPMSMILWITAAIAGIVAFVVGLATGNTTMLLCAAIAPLPASLLWSGQYRAGLMASVGALFIVPPTVAVALGYGAYWTLERVGRATAASRSTRRFSSEFVSPSR